MLARALSLAVLLSCLGCPGKPCTAPTRDAGCPSPSGACVDADAGALCDSLNYTCGCCLAPANECTMLECSGDGDGGLRWGWVTAIAPPECRPGP